MKIIYECLSTSVLRAEPGKLDIKRREPGGRVARLRPHDDAFHRGLHCLLHVRLKQSSRTEIQ